MNRWAENDVVVARPGHSFDGGGRKEAFMIEEKRAQAFQKNGRCLKVTWTR